MRFLFPLKSFVLAFAVLGLAGCAGSKIKNTTEIAASGLPRPQQVLIYNFAVSPSEVKAGSGLLSKLQNTDPTAEEMQIGREVADALATELTVKLQSWGLNAIRADQNMPLNPGSILITGQFVNIDEGSRLKRTVIGFGAGQSSIDANVSVMAPTNQGYQQLIGFDAHADSGKMPGAAVMGPVGAAAGAGTAAVVATNATLGAVKNYKSSSAQEAKGMADEVAKALGKYFAEQGWIDPSLVK
ncbi:protein of unknown function [Methylomagnum ishizawai]|uniref:DUF4410 domain-containing protein n=1 Tax=Methylomagnum ishizawai TaxID=1760988 RepID=A0A1Y6CVY3_9GAMM|nr:DUF4410 domain-containing protein [Methylomagnum ishizawai]SMF94819.1 protein of unknown function [Methylomagnum ishizawai]